MVKKRSGSTSDISIDDDFEDIEQDESDEKSGRFLGESFLSEEQGNSFVSNKTMDDFCMIWWDLEGKTKEILDTHTNENYKSKVQQASSSALIFSPDDNMKTIWDVLIALVLSVSIFVLPFRIAFLEWRMPLAAQDCQDAHDSSKCSSNRCIWDEMSGICRTPQLWYILLYIDTAIDFLFLADVAVSFRSAYFVERNSERVLITDSKKIAIHYIKTWFIVDVSASVPIEFVNLLMQSRQNSVIGRALNSTKLIRLVNLAKMLRLLKIWRLKEMWAGYISNTIMDLVGFMFVFVIIAHTMACFMFWVGTFQDFTCDRVTPLCSEDDVLQGNTVTWVTRSYILTRDSGELSVDELRIDYQYLISLYWAFTTMTTVGYGDLKPKTIYEVWALIVCMLIGATTFSLLVGTVSHSIDRIRGSDFWERAYGTLSFMHGHRLPRDLRRRVREFLGHERSASSHEVHGALLRDLSPIIQKGVLMNVHHEMLSGSPALRGLCDKGAIDLLGSLALRLRTELCHPGGILFAAGEPARALLFLESGTLQLVDAETSSHFATFRPGSQLGDNCLLDGQEAHAFSAVSESWSVVHRLARADVEEALEDRPALLHSVRLAAQLRWTRLKQAVEAHRALRCARNRKPGLTGQSLLRVLSTLSADGSPAAHKAQAALTAEERGLLQQLRTAPAPAGFWRALALKVEAAPRGEGGEVVWDWSGDWVDDPELPSVTRWFERSCGSAALAGKVAAGLALEARPAVDLGGSSIAAMEAGGGGPGYAGPARELERALAHALRRLEVVEAQAALLPELERDVLALQENLLIEETAAAARF